MYPDEPRPLSVWLILAVLTAPLLFAWLTLRRGYSKDVRSGAFLNAGLAVMMGLAR